MKFAESKGFDTVATGHYAKLGEENGVHVLQKADDRNKDQSYFLTEIHREVLDHVLFPLGSVDKPTVRKLAEELDLSIAKKKDSTGICFREAFRQLKWSRYAQPDTHIQLTDQ